MLPNNYLKTIGASFRQIRESRNLKREYIAAKCGVSIAAIAKLEQGKTDVGIAKIIYYLLAMDATIIDLATILPPPTEEYVLHKAGRIVG